MKKPFFLIAITMAAVGSVFALMHYMRMDSFTFAWALNLSLMFYVLAFIETSKVQLTSTFHDEKEWERRGKIYELLGINFFRKLLVWIGWEKLTRKSHPIEKSTAALMNLHLQTKNSELGHLIILVIVLGVTIFVAFKFGVLKSLWLLLLNVLLNLYPVFLQRYNRPRIQRAIQLSQRR